MYNVIITLDESRNRSYYYSYVAKDGNIECEELPPYADANKARSCWWDGGAWAFDADKHAELVAAQAAEEEAAEQARREAEAVPTNAELALAVIELAAEVAAMKGGK